MVTVLRAALVIWFVAVLAAGTAGGFVAAPGQPPLAILMGALVPLILFVAGYAGSRPFRALVLAADLRLLTAIQAWRAGGLVFLAFYAYDLLPGLFAWPAGLGDIAIGVSAPWMAAALTRDPAFAADARFAAWHVLGIADLVVAVAAGTLTSGVVPGLTVVATAPMSHLPLVLIPAFLVPLFVMLHVTALLSGAGVAQPHHHPGGSELDDVAVLQQARRTDHLAVDEGSAGAFHVLDAPASAGQGEPGVAAGHGDVVESQIRAGVPSEHADRPGDDVAGSGFSVFQVHRRGRRASGAARTGSR
jgi:hypothetical protein